MSDALTHPAPRAIHATRNAMQIALALHTEDGERLFALLATVPADVIALYEYTQAIEADLRGLRDQGIADARDLTRLRDTNDGLNVALTNANRQLAAQQVDVEALCLESHGLVAQVSAIITRTTALRLSGDALSPSVPTHTNWPRLAVEG